MSREVRRVPLDFRWELNKVWDGYLMPDSLKGDLCPSCYRLNYKNEREYGSGSTSAAKWVEAVLYLIGMMADDVNSQAYRGTAHQFTQYGDDRSKLHPYLATLQGINVYEHRRPSADIVELVTGITGRSSVSFGTGSDFAYRGMAALVKAAGLPENWGICPTCEGHGSVEKYPGQREDAENWQPTEPPEGEGWQYWETVSEGSPISPVFDTAEGLAQWLSSPGYNWGTGRPMAIETAREIVNGSGWVPSGIITAEHGVMTGEEAIAQGVIRG